MLRPVNDLAKIEVETDKFGFGGGTRDKAVSGILRELPNKFVYFGMWSFAFEESFMAKDKLEEIYKHYQEMIGQRVYWTALSEKGNMLEQDGKTYCFVKLTSLIASDEEVDNIATGILDDHAGAYSI
jgi:hypothetical protein